MIESSKLKIWMINHLLSKGWWKANTILRKLRTIIVSKVVTKWRLEYWNLGTRMITLCMITIKYKTQIKPLIGYLLNVKDKRINMKSLKLLYKIECSNNLNICDTSLKLNQIGKERMMNNLTFCSERGEAIYLRLLP